MRDQIERSHLCLDAMIDDYPIGRRERGKCRLQVERAANKGYRTVRTTANKAGRWCKPHKSTYSNSLIVVVRDWDTEHQHAWLSCGNPRAEYGGVDVCVQYANGAGIALAKCWRNDAPRREQKVDRVTWTTTRLGVSHAGLENMGQSEETKEYVYDADSTEECGAWDVWVAELETVRQLLFNVWKEAEVKTDQAVVAIVF